MLEALGRKESLEPVQQRERPLEVGKAVGSGVLERQQADEQELQHLLVDEASVGAPGLGADSQRRVNAWQVAAFAQPCRQLEGFGGGHVGGSRAEPRAEERTQPLIARRPVQLRGREETVWAWAALSADGAPA